MAIDISNHPAFTSINPFLPPLKLEPSSPLSWPNDSVVSSLRTLSKGPGHSKVDSGKQLFNTIAELRQSLSLSADHLAPSCSDGYAWFFDQCLPRDESTRFFSEVVPVMATMLLRFPELLASHYSCSRSALHGREVETGLRLLEPQQPGVVFLRQDLIGALLACSFFCLFPSDNRNAKELQGINFDHIFMSAYGRYNESQKNKIKCFLHYFERVCSSKLTGFVSFERKVLPMEHNAPIISYPSPELWAESAAPLCRFEVYYSGTIEDHSEGSLEVDFADEYLGGILLTWGCEQEEIRFLINPELTAGMFFLPRMADNEAIEIVGAERFINYTGYGPSFRYAGNHVDRRGVDYLGRRLTRVIAIDALPNPGIRQYGLQCLLREVNKAFCGFRDQLENLQQEHQNDAGVTTGNWGCGVFGGDPEVKTMLQWLAASQASRPFIAYYTFGEERLRNLDQVCQSIISRKWPVGDLWNKLVDYSSKRANGETQLGFFYWMSQFTKCIS